MLRETYIKIAAFGAGLWFVAWIAFEEFALWRYWTNTMFQNMIGGLIVVEVLLIILAAEKRVGSNPTAPNLCPSCREPLSIQAQVKPFVRIVYECQNPKCPVSTRVPKKEKSKKGKKEKNVRS